MSPRALALGAVALLAAPACDRAAPAPSTATATASSPPSAVAQEPVPTATPAPNLKAEARDLRVFKATYGNTRHFVAELHNTGDAPIGYPIAQITLHDAAGAAVDKGACASLARVLDPGDKVPCFFSTSKTDGFVTTKIEITPTKSTYAGRLADLDVTDVKLTRKVGYQPHTLDGKITNKSSFAAKSVWALVALYGADGKIVGVDYAQVAGESLEPGQSGRFSAKVYEVAAPPDTFRVKPVGYSD